MALAAGGIPLPLDEVYEMGKYIGKRLLLMIPVVIGVAITIFTIMYFVPGDPAQIILGTSATEADLAAKRTELGLDQPYLVRLGTYLVL